LVLAARRPRWSANLDCQHSSPPAMSDPSASSPSTSPSSSHLASRLEALAVSSRPSSSSPLTQELDRQDVQKRVQKLDQLGDSSTGDWEKGRVPKSDGEYSHLASCQSVSASQAGKEGWTDEGKNELAACVLAGPRPSNTGRLSPASILANRCLRSGSI
jgi:hypothetical protein